VDVDAATVDLAAEAEEVAEQFLPQAEDATVDLQVDIEEPPLRAQADQKRIRITLRNLISNAIKYTEPGGDVWLRVRRENGRAALEVEDTGVGMDPKKTDELFEPFRQEPEGFGREYEGTGLGLAVTKQAVDQVGGTIDVETAKGEGSQFIVRPPRPEANGEQ
jgi:signal transduction histidine kinase